VTETTSSNQGPPQPEADGQQAAPAMDEMAVLADAAARPAGHGDASGGVAVGASDLSAGSMDLLSEIELEASVELGRTNLSIGEVLSLVPGSVVHINKMLGDPVELVIKDRLIARGEVVIVDDKFGLRITELASDSGGEGSRR